MRILQKKYKGDRSRIESVMERAGEFMKADYRGFRRWNGRKPRHSSTKSMLFGGKLNAS